MTVDKKSAASLMPLALLLPALATGASGDADNGEKLYYDFGCYSCHGYNATMRVPLVEDASAIMGSEQLFLTYLRLRAEQNPVNPKNTMPNYDARTLSDGQALDIYAYIKSVTDDPPEPGEDAVMKEIIDAAKARGNRMDERREEGDAGESQ